jgi:hypothetical protein
VEPVRRWISAKISSVVKRSSGTVVVPVMVLFPLGWAFIFSAVADKFTGTSSGFWLVGIHRLFIVYDPQSLTIDGSWQHIE